MKRLYGLVLTTLLTLPAAAQEAPDSAAVAKARHDYEREAVVSCRLNQQGDTLLTSDPSIRIVMYPDYTWRYIKDPAVVQEDELFSRNWDNVSVDPYHTSLESLPYSWSIWVVDSLGSYHCPNHVDVYSPYGVRHGRRHQGVDLPLKTGDPVYAAFDGKVRISKYTGGYGNLVVLRHANGLETFYGHLSRSNVNVGDWVHAGQVIGQGGSTGRSTGPHLHFETRWQGYSFDPQRLIDFKTGNLRHRLFLLRKRYFNDNSKFAQTDDDEEAIALSDAEDYKKAEQERKKAEAAQQQWHKIKKGDTLSGLAKKYHTTVSAICRLNKGLTAKSTLQLGKNIRVR